MRKISAEELRGFPVAGPRNSGLATEMYGLFDEDSDLLGIVLQDKHDCDFSFVVLTRRGQPQGQYAAIDLGVSYQRSELAESALKTAMEHTRLAGLAGGGPETPGPQKPDEGEGAGVKLDMLTCRDCKTVELLPDPSFSNSVAWRLEDNAPITVMVIPNPEAEEVRKAHVKDPHYRSVGWREMAPFLTEPPTRVAYYVMWGYRGEGGRWWEMGQYVHTLDQATSLFHTLVAKFRKLNLENVFPLTEYVRIYEGTGEGIYRRNPLVHKWKWTDELC